MGIMVIPVPCSLQTICRVRILSSFRDGATRSGLFCALINIISRMTYDRELDVYLTVRHVQSARHQAVDSRVRLDVDSITKLTANTISRVFCICAAVAQNESSGCRLRGKTCRLGS